MHLKLTLLFIVTLFVAPFVKGQSSHTVYIFMLEDCVITQNYTLQLRQLYEQYQADGIEFVGIFPNRFSSTKTIEAFKLKYNIPFELKYDYYQGIAKKWKATVTPEVVVVDNISEQIKYRGRIDDTYFRVGKRRQVTTTSELSDALAAIVAGSPIVVPATQAVGCFIKYEQR